MLIDLQSDHEMQGWRVLADCSGSLWTAPGGLLQFEMQRRPHWAQSRNGALCAVPPVRLLALPMPGLALFPSGTTSGVLLLVVSPFCRGGAICSVCCVWLLPVVSMPCLVVASSSLWSLLLHLPSLWCLLHSLLLVAVLVQSDGVWVGWLLGGFAGEFV